MENYEYEAVKTDVFEENVEKISRKYLFRQLILASALWTLYFNGGLFAGTPTVLIPQMRRENLTLIDDELASWLYASSNLAFLPWVLIIPAISSFIGRKLPYLVSSACMLVSFTILYFSTTPYHVIISGVIQGFANASNFTIAVVIISEYTDPRYRGLFLSIKSASYFWRFWISNAIGTFLHYKYIAVAGVMSTFFTFIGSCHPESPYWLASKGRYEETRSAFRWLHGTSRRSEQELRCIIDAQNSRDGMKITFENLTEIISCRLFYLPLGLTLLTSCLAHFSGKLVCSSYALDIIMKMTDDEGAAYTGMLILDGVTVFGMYSGAFASKFFKRRVLFLTSSVIGVLFLFILSLYLYLVKLSVIDERTVVSILLLTIYSVATSCGPMIMSMTIPGEILPLKYQAICYSINLTLFTIIHVVQLKLTPIMFKGLGMDGSFLLYGILAGLSGLLLYLYLPETKDKTMVEIEDYFSNEKERDGRFQ